MIRLKSQHGSALVAALGLAAILLPLAALVAVQTRVDLLIQRNLGAEIETFYAAEAALEQALSQLPLTGSFERLCAGPDGVLDTPDDGVFPYATNPTSLADDTIQPLLSVAMEQAGRLRIESTAVGDEDSTATLSATVVRCDTPYTPAALYLEGTVAAFELGTNFTASGNDANPHRTGARTGPAKIPALSSSSAQTEALVRSMVGTETAQVVGYGGAPSIATTPPFAVDNYARGYLSRPEAIQISGVYANATIGTPAAPILAISTGPLEIGGGVSGAGILVVEGTFRVTGTFAYRGLVIALGGVIFEADSDVALRGALWRAQALDERMALRGRGSIHYDSDALMLADRSAPGVLPHAAVVVGWRETL